MLQLGFGMKLHGVNWRSEMDFGAFIAIANAVGLIEVDGLNLVRRGTKELKPVPAYMEA